MDKNDVVEGKSFLFFFRRVSIFITGSLSVIIESEKKDEDRENYLNSSNKMLLSIPSFSSSPPFASLFILSSSYMVCCTDGVILR